jgi:hypothetical protein
MAYYVFGKLPGKAWEKLEPKLPSEAIANSMLAEWRRVSKPGSEFEVREVHEEDPVPVRRVPRMAKART